MNVAPGNGPAPNGKPSNGSGFALVVELTEQQLDAIAERAAAMVVERESPEVARWLTVAEAAEYLRCPTSRVYSLVSVKRIPFVKDGSRTLFDRGELDAWLHNGGGKRP
jgi:excisionase family DNA binding protein